MQYPRNTSVFCSLNYLSRGFLSLAKPLSFSHVLESCGHGPFYVIRKPQFSKQEAGVLGLDDGLDGVPTLRSSGFSPVCEPARRHLSISGSAAVFSSISVARSLLFPNLAHHCHPSLVATAVTGRDSSRVRKTSFGPV